MLRISTITALLILFCFSLCQAQDYAAMQQQSMQQMQQMADCMAKIDQQKLQALEKQGMEFMEKVRELCSQGERDQAERLAIDYHKKMENDPTVKALDKCSEGFKAFSMNGLPGQEDEDKDAGEGGHICDELE